MHAGAERRSRWVVLWLRIGFVGLLPLAAVGSLGFAGLRRFGVSRLVIAVAWAGAGAALRLQMGGMAGCQLAKL